MRLKELLQESPGFNAVGPSGIRYPQGADPRHNYGDMYPGQRFGRAGTDPYEPVSDHIHIEQINQRIEGGMPENQAIAAQAKKAGYSTREMIKIYNNQINEKEISCRSDEGITVGLVDSFITNLRLFKDRDLSPESVQEALLDVADDPDFKYFLKALKNAKQKSSNT